MSSSQAQGQKQGQQVAVVTGAGRGVGRATARLLLEKGWAVMAVARTEADLVETIYGHPSGVVCPGDIRNAKLGLDLQAIIRRRYGKVNAIINNAGLAPMRPFEETGEKMLADVMATNFTGAFSLTRHLWPFLRRRGGCVVNVSSKATVDPFPGLSAYAAAKAALEGWTRVLAVEGKEHNIRANCVAPAGVETRMLRDLPVMEEVPTEALLRPEDVAQAIADCLDGKHASGDVVRLER